MLTIVHRLLDFIFPPRATELLVRGLSTETLLPLYQARTHESVLYLLPYQTDVVRALIQENKFHKNILAAKLLAGILEHFLSEKILQRTILIPIPLSQIRKKTRGYNQVEYILEHLSHTSSLEINTTLLTRTKDTVPQTSLAREARLRNMKCAFIATIPPGSCEDSTIVIIDDVVTTGATLVAARAALASHLLPNTKIICLALAH
jgi:ComF family protein